MTRTLINGRWELDLPPHRAERPEWVTGWERQRLDRMYKTIKPGQTIFDIGTEEGDLTGLYALWGAQVVMFEPNPYVWPNIRWIWDANQLPPPLGRFAGFASDTTNLHPAEIEPIFLEPARDGWPACAYGPLIGDHGFRVVTQRSHDTPQTTLDDWVSAHTIIPDVITMDVEGAEFRVVQGARRLLSAHRPTVFMSVHESFLINEYGDHPKHLWDYMTRFGYEAELLWWDHEAHVQWSPT